MESRGFINGSFVTGHEDSENSPENSCGSPHTAISTDNKLSPSTSSPRRSRRSIEKRVVSVPIIKDVDGSRPKGEISNTPPSDSWAWRKYGQKPIKGSPYPRGYYRCSSSKGCPARKQVERSREDPNVLLVTYSCEHNHPWPVPRNNQRSQNNYSTSSTTTIISTVSPVDVVCKSEQEEEEKEDDKQRQLATTNYVSSHKSYNDHKFNNVGSDQQILPPIGGSEFGWLSDFECTSGDTMLESQILTEGRLNNVPKIMDIDVFDGSIMREEDELLFADLGELPEFSMVFNRGMIQRDEECRTPWCGATS
ncbi:hypothetical protein Leryth_022285 [Lithospermum erythrorhizon]|nr:hypothetical protein Leryth_022285 [Lithospermum erythrorhizon]